MATFTIISTSDFASDTSTGTLDGSGNGSGTLREAINFANQNVRNPSAVTTIRVASGVTGTITLAGNLPLVATSITFNGAGLTIDGANAYRGFLISGIALNGQDAAATTVGLSNLTIQNVVARGGAGAGGGGGGLGAGGAIFLGAAANVTLTNVSIGTARAIGGAGGTSGYSGGGGGGLGGGGGGGFGSNGGGGLFSDGGSNAGGGGGITSAGGNGGGAGGSGLGGLGGGGGGGGYGGSGGGMAGGTGATSGGSGQQGMPGYGIPTTGGDGGLGGFGGGGGGGGGNNVGGYNSLPGNGGSGGFGGGGAGRGGSGGFGGGGGGRGGTGGFGGGGGSYGSGGGFGGGSGAASGGGDNGGGGGGGAMGGAIFVTAGGTLTVAGTFSESGGAVTGGAGGNGATAGSVYGAGVFYEGGNGAPATLTFGAGDHTLAHAITDLNGAAGNTTTFNGLVGSGGITAIAKTGTGRLKLSTTNTYTGGTTLRAGTVELATLRAAGSGTIAFSAGAQTLQLDTAGTLVNAVTGFAFGDTIDLRTIDSTGVTFTLSGANLTIIEAASRGTDRNRLTIGAAPTGYKFALGSDGAGGTKLTLARGVVARPAAPTLTAASDTGISATDRITKDTTPTFTGTSFAGAKLTLYDGSTLVGTAVAASNGAYSVTSAARGAGSRAFTVKAADAIGNFSTASPVTNVTIDTARPVAPTKPALDPLRDTGISSSDGITRSTTLVYTGTAEAGSTVTLLEGSTQVGSVVATSSNTYRIVLSGVAQGTHSYAATATDKAGNVSARSITAAVSVDTTAPTAPTKPVLAAANDTGVSSTDGITQSTTLSFTGTATAGSTVTLLEGTTQVGSIVAASNNTYRIDLSGVAQGAHSYAATATDKAGNVSTRSPAAAVTVDTTAPDVAITSSGGATPFNHQTITGTGEAGTVITLIRNGMSVGNATVASSGNWSRAVTLVSGDNQFVATDTDTAGNFATSSAVTYNYMPPVIDGRQAAIAASGPGAMRMESAASPSSLAHALFDATFSPASNSVASTHAAASPHPMLAAPS